jgi:hypothetical protein
MSVIGSPLETAVLSAIQAQQVASRARDREKAESATGRRFEDLVELRVTGAESAEAVRAIPQNDSEQAETEHDAQHELPQRLPQPHIDVRA